MSTRVAQGLKDDPLGDDHPEWKGPDKRPSMLIWIPVVLSITVDWIFVQWLIQQGGRLIS